VVAADSLVTPEVIALARGSVIGSSELALEELESSATEDEIVAERAVAKTTNVVAFTRKRPARQPFPCICHASG